MFLLLLENANYRIYGETSDTLHKHLRTLVCCKHEHSSRVFSIVMQLQTSSSQTSGSRNIINPTQGKKKKGHKFKGPKHLPEVGWVGYFSDDLGVVISLYTTESVLPACQFPVRLEQAKIYTGEIFLRVLEICDSLKFCHCSAGYKFELNI